MPELYPWQVTGAAWLSERRRAGLFDDQGLGKTITAIAGADRIGARSMLVVAPTVVLWNWAREIATFSKGRQVTVCDTRRARVPNGDQVAIVSHGLMFWPGIFHQLTDRRWDLVVVDECQEFRGPDSQRSNALYDLKGRGEPHVVGCADWVWLLSGTPMPNYASELWTHFRGIWPDRIREGAGPMSFKVFRKRYCILRMTEYGPKPIANKNLAELKGRLQGVTLRRRKKDELKSLAAARFELVTLKPKKLPWELTELDGRVRPKVVEKIRKQFDEEGNELTAGAGWRSLKDHEGMSRLRQLAGLAKVAPTVELLQMELELGADKLVIGAWHLEVIEELRRALVKFRPVVLTGSVGARERQRIVDRFQTDPACRVFIGQIKAAGVGVTLTAATEAVIVEGSFVPGHNAQFADRIHRIGQEGQCRIRFLALADSTDEDVVSILKNKTRMIREVLD